MVYLKAIEASGFKSFADKLKIHFDNGVTAIVGPNGSGKSNITDAIRWVLGEQSARIIRGDSMQDVIFNGTEYRSPMNYASVKLILNNEDRELAIDYDEVHITRKLFRSGDSEYFINNEKSKLKNITDLFLDSGLGKNAYNIISQGQVEEVLKAKPYERRYLIEEAAGVMRYKLKKKSSEKKLNDTKENLNRINDIISELKVRVEKLEEESAIAEEYLALSEEIEQYEIEVLVYDIKSLQKESEETQSFINEKEHIIHNSKEKLLEIESKINEISNQNELDNEYVKSLHQQLLESTREIEQLTGKIHLYNERLTNRAEVEKELTHKNKKIREKISHLSKNLRHQEQEHDQSQNFIKEMQQSLKDVKKSIELLVQDNSETIETLKDEYYDLMVQKTTLKNEANSKKLEQERIIESKKSQLERLESLKQSFQFNTEEYEKLKQTTNDQNAQLSDTRYRYKEINDTLNNLTHQYDVNKDNYNKATQYIDQLTSKKTMLENMVNEYRGFFPGVKEVLKSKDYLNGIVGAFGTLISADTKYLTAIDTALSGQSQNIVVDTENDAKAAIRYLKDKRAGFATFLPVNVIKHKSIPDDIKQKINRTPLNIEILSNITHIDDKHKNILSHLLGSTLVAETIDDATMFAQEIQYRLRIVTLTGETVMPGGALSGGSRNNKNSIIENQKELLIIKEKLDDYTAKVKQLENKLTLQKEEMTNHLIQLEQVEAEGRKVKEDYESNVARLNQIKYELSLQQSQIQTIEYEVVSYSSNEPESDYQASIEKLNDKLQNIEDKIRIYSTSDKEKKIELEQLNDEKQTIEREIISSQSKMEYVLTSIENLKEDIDEANIELKNNDEQLQMLNDNISELNIDELKGRLIELEQSSDKLNRELDTHNDKAYSARQEIQTLNNERSTHLNTIEDLQSQLRNFTGQFEKIHAKMDQKLSTLNEKYKLTYERAKSQFPTFTDIDNKRLKIHLNLKSIEELGTVNLKSIDEFKEVNERFVFLKAQEGDLLDAHHTLTNIIREMDEEVSSRFKTVFESVNHHFKNVFMEMFGGGNAELRLTEPNNYLNSGIEIFAEPPGKKLSSLSLLSGGEKALTTISLLFSILKVKSSPFIILDEVEAALDERNVLRYGQYLKQLSRSTQFIVITHRKGTMEYSDRLFGVTMAEKGVSQLITVDLSKYDETLGDE